jgi:excisionase family DNA binding protein
MDAVEGHSSHALGVTVRAPRRLFLFPKKQTGTVMSIVAEAKAKGVSPPANAPRMVGPVELAAALGVKKETITNWARSGRLPKPVRIGRTIRWPRSVIEDLLEGRLVDR